MTDEIKRWTPKRKGNYMVKIYEADQNMFFDAPMVVFRCLECEYYDKVIVNRLTYKYCPNCGKKLVNEVGE